MIQKRYRMLLLFSLFLTITGCSLPKQLHTSDLDEFPIVTPHVSVVSAASTMVVTSSNIVAKAHITDTTVQGEENVQNEVATTNATPKHPKVLINPYGNAPLSAYVIFTTKTPSSVSFTIQGKTKATSISGKVKAKKNHRVPLIGLYPGKNTVKLAVREGKKVTRTKLSVTTPALPADLQDQVRVIKGGKQSAYPLTMISGQTTKYPFAYDVEGNIRWYLTVQTGSYGIFPLSKQRLILQAKETKTPTAEKPHTTQMHEMDYMGRVYHTYFVKNGVHHEVIEMEPGGNLLTLSSSIAGHTEDVVLEINRKTGQIEKELDLKDIFDKTFRNQVDWVHLNTVSYRASDHTVLLSPRNLHAGVRLDWNTNEIKWILSNPKMFEKTKQKNLVLKPQGNVPWFFQQHSIYEEKGVSSPNSDTVTIMLYDNHWETKRKVDFWEPSDQSFVRVYQVNEKKKTVTHVKSFPSVKSVITSNYSYDAKHHRMFSFGGYLYPLVYNRKGMAYEYNYKTGKLINQYSMKKYYYRGYPMKINWEDLTRNMPEEQNRLRGTLQSPKKTKFKEKVRKTIPSKEVSFTLKKFLLYITAADHTVDKVVFVSDTDQYLMDYTGAGKGMSSKKNQRYSIAIPLSELTPGTYKIYVHTKSGWRDPQRNFEILKK